MEPDQIDLKYATGLEILALENGVFEVTVKRPYKSADQSLVYYLVPEAIPYDANGGTVIRTPVDRIICTSTTHIPLLDYLNETSSLVGFPTLNYISSTKMRKHIESGNVMDLGVDKSMNVELALSLEPDVVMAYSIAGNDPVHQKLRDLNIPVLINAEYLEEHPLGRAEWIKLAGLLFDKKEMSDSIFNQIEKNYLELSERLSSVADRPMVLSGVMYGDTWFLPGGNNYAAKLMADAAITYPWAENPDTGFLEVSFESVLDKAREAEFWIGVASFGSLNELYMADERYALFKAYQLGNIYTYHNARKNKNQGSDYLELGYLRPDMILHDLIQIAHPVFIENDTMYFYSKLEP